MTHQTCLRGPIQMFSLSRKSVLFNKLVSSNKSAQNTKDDSVVHLYGNQFLKRVGLTIFLLYYATRLKFIFLQKNMFSKNYRFGLDSKNTWAYMLQCIVHNNQFLSVLNNLYNLSGGVDKDVCIHTEILALSFNFSIVFILLNVNLMLLLDILYVLVMFLKKKEGNCQYRTI